MKLNNNYCLLGIILISTGLLSCKNDDDEPTTPPATYNSMAEFYAANDVKAEVFTFDVAQGGNFTTAKGTKVKIKPNSFVDEQNNPVTGNVKLTFKDLYSKSEMMFSGISTATGTGLLKSAGEFFIKAELNDNPLLIAPGLAIEVEQPAKDGQVDPDMKPFVLVNGPLGAPGWFNSIDDSLEFKPSSYIFSLYQFTTPVGDGTWCNSDNPTFFSAYTNTVLTITPDQDPTEYGTDVYLIFTGINTMVHVYYDNNVYPYNFSPIGLDCTIVAVGVKGGKIYAAFKPVTISNALNVNITLTETTNEEFKAQMTALNN